MRDKWNVQSEGIIGLESWWWQFCVMYLCLFYTSCDSVTGSLNRLCVHVYLVICLELVSLSSFQTLTHPFPVQLGLQHQVNLKLKLALEQLSILKSSSCLLALNLKVVLLQYESIDLPPRCSGRSTPHSASTLNIGHIVYNQYIFKIKSSLKCINRHHLI